MGGTGRYQSKWQKIIFMLTVMRIQRNWVFCKMRELEISEEPIELYKILKLDNMVNSGGEAKYVISEGQVIINGKVETRKRKKIFSGDVVEFGKEEIRIQVK
jgi:ribosome-associated protein